jgi:hypothetical protein
MEILKIIAESLQTQRANPSVVLNALIELDNDGGKTLLYELEYRLERINRTLWEQRDPSHGVAKAWLTSTRAYIETWYSPRLKHA